VIGFDPDTHEATLVSLHPGVRLEEVLENTVSLARSQNLPRRRCPMQKRSACSGKKSTLRVFIWKQVCEGTRANRRFVIVHSVLCHFCRMRR
jgi:hypothetical protein